jgi:uncharacterized protein Yka (UPF0111/DUF47 family)
MFGIGSSKSDRSFYEAFERHAACIVEAGRLLTEIATHPARAVEIAEKVKAVENAGDLITHQTISQLHKTWITPIDRADIHSLITALDDVLGFSRSRSGALRPVRHQYAARLRARPGQGAGADDRSGGQAINSCAGEASEEMLDLCVEINRLENEADVFYRQGLASLFRGGYEAMDVMKWRDIIDNLESATDRCEDVANILEGIVLEYS